MNEIAYAGLDYFAGFNEFEWILMCSLGALGRAWHPEHICTRSLLGKV